jgi:hypothetical protein
LSRAVLDADEDHVGIGRVCRERSSSLMFILLAAVPQAGTWHLPGANGIRIVPLPT